MSSRFERELLSDIVLFSFLLRYHFNNIYVTWLIIDTAADATVVSTTRRVTTAVRVKKQSRGKSEENE